MKIEEMKALIGGCDTSSELQITVSPDNDGYRVLLALKGHADQGSINLEDELLLKALVSRPNWSTFSLDLNIKFSTWGMWNDIRFWRLVEAGVKHIKIINPT